MLFCVPFPPRLYKPLYTLWRLCWSTQPMAEYRNSTICGRPSSCQRPTIIRQFRWRDRHRELFHRSDTSGALPSDEDIANFDVSPSVELVKQILRTPKFQVWPLSVRHWEFGIPSPGFSNEDYAPLSSMRATPTATPAGRSPPRKRRRMISKPWKVMEPAYFKGIQWTKVFVSGPLYPVHNKYKFYCQICKTNVSIFSKGAREIVRHYQSEAHLRKVKRWRFEHSGTKNKITGVIKHEVRAKDGHILTALELEKEKPPLETATLVDIGSEYPFYEEYLERTGGSTTPADVATRNTDFAFGAFHTTLRQQT